jgi:tetratricopeptide (TPR) repeat protein
MAPEDLRMVYRTFAEVFPDVSLWAVNDSDMLLLGTVRPQRLRYSDLTRALADRPVAQRDLRELGFRNPYSLLAMYQMPKAALLRMAGEAEVNLDDVPRLEYSAPRNLGRETTTLNSRLTKDFVVPPAVEDADPERDASGRLSLYLAYGYKAVRDREQALTWVERGLQKDPTDVEARLLRARLLAEDGRSVAAAEELRKAEGGAIRWLEDVLEVAKSLDPDDAIPILRRIGLRDPRLVEVRLALADVLLRAGQPRQAESEYREVQPNRPMDPHVLFGLGKALLTEADYANALVALDGAAKLGETSADLQARRGEALMWLGRYQDAAAAYRLALRGDVERVIWRLNLGISLAQLGPDHLVEAERRLREVLAMESANTRAWQELHKLGKRF